MTAQELNAKPWVSEAHADVMPNVTRLLDTVDNDALPMQHSVFPINTPDDYNYAWAGVLANNAWYFNTVAWFTQNGAYAYWDFYLAAGDWRIEWFSDKRNDYGVQILKFDGGTHTLIDHYAAARTRFVDSTVKYGVTRGWHRVGRLTSGKNAASSGYLMTMSAMILTRVD